MSLLWKQLKLLLDTYSYLKILAEIIAALGLAGLIKQIMALFNVVSGGWQWILVSGIAVMVLCWLDTVRRRTPHTLEGRARRLADDLLAFLREKGPEPQFQEGDSSSGERRFREFCRATAEYVPVIHQGYEHRFRQRVIDFFNELGEHGINVSEVAKSDIDPVQGQSAERIKTIANALHLTATRIEAAKAAKGT